jgi:hypothetical protein
MLPPVEVRAHSREKEERRRAEMCDPANQKVAPPGLRDVFRFKGDIADEISGMVEGHDDHRQAANNVDRGDASTTRIGNLQAGVLNGNLLFQP